MALAGLPIVAANPALTRLLMANRPPNLTRSSSSYSTALVLELNPHLFFGPISVVSMITIWFSAYFQKKFYFSYINSYKILSK